MIEDTHAACPDDLGYWLARDAWLAAGKAAQRRVAEHRRLHGEPYPLDLPTGDLGRLGNQVDRLAR